MKLPILAFLACLVATPSFAASAPGLNLTDLIRASDADLAAAVADATAHGDTFATECYTGIQAYNAANPKATLSITKPAGVVSAFQGARDIVKGVQNPKDFIPSALVQACGPLALDVQGDLGKVGPSFLGIKF